MQDEKPASAEPASPRETRGPWHSPVVFIAVTILLSILALVLFAILDWDRGGVLRRMSEIGFARGLITYLFAVATMGTAIVLIVYALTSPRRDSDPRFENGKEILSLLLGVFGTIVGFYFGREGALPPEAPLAVAPLRLSANEVAAGATVHLTTVALGGKAPIRYIIAVGDQKTNMADATIVYSGGWIEKDITVPSEPGQAVIKVVVQDADRHESEQSAAISVTRKPAP